MLNSMKKKKNLLIQFLPVEQTILFDMGNDDVTKANVFLEISVMWNATSDTNDKHIVDLLKRSQQTCCRVSSGCHRFASASHRWQFGADNAMRTNIAQCVHIGFA